MIVKESRRSVRGRRHTRIRGRVSGTSERPRLVVFRSSKHIYAQVVDDTQRTTLVAASSVDPDLRKSLKNGATVEAAEKVGELVAERAKSKGIEQVVYDRGGNLYHGRVAALAEGARKGGLEF